MKDSWIYKVVAENNVPKTILRGKAYFSKSHIDRIFSSKKKNENPEITEWYSVEDIQAKYGMTLSAIYCLVLKIISVNFLLKVCKGVQWCVTVCNRVQIVHDLADWSSPVES